MNQYHQDLTSERWSQMSLVEQLANVGSEVERAISWKNKGNPEYSQTAFFRALELLDFSLQVNKIGSRLKELARLRESLVDYFFGENTWKSSDHLWHNYFYAFTYAAALARGKDAPIISGEV